MNSLSFLPTALRIAKRELRHGLKGFKIILFSLALGVGIISTIGTLSSSLEKSLYDDAKILLGGDFEIVQTHVPIKDELLSFLKKQGKVAELLRLRSMARSTSSSLLVEVKGVDLNYPLLGSLESQPQLELTSALGKDTNNIYGALADSAMLKRLNLNVGDTFSMGSLTYQMRGVLTLEPDRVASFFGFGPRVIVSNESLQASGLILPGSIIRYIYKVLLTSDIPFEDVKQEIFAQFPESRGLRIRGYSSQGSRITRFMDRMTLNLTLIGLASLLLGGIGISSAIRSFLQTRNESIAAMKCLGAERKTILTAYIIQTMTLGLLGSLIGVTIGIVGASILAPLLSQSLNISLKGFIFIEPILYSLGFGLLITLIFSIGPLSAAANVSPARLFRGYVDIGSKKPGFFSQAWIMAIFFLLLLTAWMFTGDLVLVVASCLGMIVSYWVFLLLSMIIIRLTKSLPQFKDLRIRHALANITRPGSTSKLIVSTLGLGFTVLMIISLVDDNLQRQIRDSIPDAAPSYFFLDIPGSTIGPFQSSVESFPGVTQFDTQPSIRGRITHIDGVPSEQRVIDPDSSWAIRSDRAITFVRSKPKEIELSAGSWWPEDYNGPPILCFDQDLADGFGITVGDTITLSVLGREIVAEIACLRKIDWTTLQLNQTIIVPPNVLAGAPFTYLAAAYVEDDKQDAFFDFVAKSYPSIATIYVRDVLRDVSTIIGHIGLALRVAASIALIAGVLVLSQAIGATMKRRHFESIVFKVLGATKRDISLSIFIEFFILGTITTVIATVLGSLVAAAFIIWVLQLSWSFSFMPVVSIGAGGLILFFLVGIVGIRSVLKQKVWPYLRNE